MLSNADSYKKNVLEQNKHNLFDQFDIKITGNVQPLGLEASPIENNRNNNNNSNNNNKGWRRESNA